MKTVIWVIVAFAIGEIVGYISCALLSVNKVIDAMEKKNKQGRGSNGKC